MLVLRDELALRDMESPLVGILPCILWAGRYEWFQRYNQSVRKFAAIMALGIIRDEPRVFVETPAESVSCQVPDEREPVMRGHTSVRIMNVLQWRS